MGESERGERAPSIAITFWCSHGHETTATFAVGDDVQPPQTWDCPRCGLPAGRNQNLPPGPIKVEPYKTHLAYVKERRSEGEATALLTEALEKLRSTSAALGS